MKWPLASIVLLVVATAAHAMDHGFDPNSDFARWAESLKRPNTAYKASCCGKGDMYGIRIEQDAIGDDDDARGVAVITDGDAIQFPDGTTRTPIPNGTRFTFPKSVVNERQGNPGKTAYAFITPSDDGVSTNGVQVVWCVIPIPPGY